MKLTKEDVQSKIFKHVGNKYTIKSEYAGIRKNIVVHCNEHDIDFSGPAGNFTKSDGLRTICPQCKREKIKSRYKDDTVIIDCAYCGKEVLRSKSKLENSKSGLYFCCREHKDLAQRLDSGEYFDIMRPDHFGTGTGISSYRPKAFKHYEHKCAICLWDEDEDMLDVHHIDENRLNNELNNLIILCPICHRKLTSHKYKLVERKQIVKNTTQQS